MDAVQTLMMDEPLGPALLAISAVLVLSLVGPPWLKTVGRDRDTLNLIDRWKLFSWLHPVLSSMLRWAAVLALDALICMPAVVIARQYDVVGVLRQAAAGASLLIWKR